VFAEAGFHLNDELNGLLLNPYSKVLGNGVHGNHPAYSKFVENRLEFFSKRQYTPESAKKYWFLDTFCGENRERGFY